MFLDYSEQLNDRNLVKSRSEFIVQEEILSLQFIVHETSPYICRSCVGKLRKRRGLYANVRRIEDELFSDYSAKAFKVGLTVKKKDRDTRKGRRRNFGFSREANSFGGVGRSFVELSQFAGYVRFLLLVLFDLRSWSDQRETILAQKTKLCYHNLCEI